MGFLLQISWPPSSHPDPEADEAEDPQHGQGLEQVTITITQGNLEGLQRSGFKSPLWQGGFKTHLEWGGQLMRATPFETKIGAEVKLAGLQTQHGEVVTMVRTMRPNAIDAHDQRSPCFAAGFGFQFGSGKDELLEAHRMTHRLRSQPRVRAGCLRPYGQQAPNRAGKRPSV